MPEISLVLCVSLCKYDLQNTHVRCRVTQLSKPAAWLKSALQVQQLRRGQLTTVLPLPPTIVAYAELDPPTTAQQKTIVRGQLC